MLNTMGAGAHVASLGMGFLGGGAAQLVGAVIAYTGIRAPATAELTCE